MKGSAGSLAARELYGLLGRLEVIAAEGSLEAARPLVARLPHALNRLYAAFASVTKGV
jgi:hypothetical protein